MTQHPAASSDFTDSYGQLRNNTVLQLNCYNLLLLPGFWLTHLVQDAFVTGKWSRKDPQIAFERGLASQVRDRSPIKIYMQLFWGLLWFVD